MASLESSQSPQPDITSVRSARSGDGNLDDGSPGLGDPGPVAGRAVGPNFAKYDHVYDVPLVDHPDSPGNRKVRDSNATLVSSTVEHNTNLVRLP